MSEGSSPQPQFGGHESEGKPGALAAWALFILSIPSFGGLVLVGLIVAYAVRGSAQGVARQHIDAQIALFWSTFVWTIVFALLWGVSLLLSAILIGIPFLFLFWLALFLLMVWFTVKSVLGLLALLQDRPPV